MIKILKENTGKLLKDVEVDGTHYFMCDINDHEYKLMLIRGSVIGVDDIRVEHLVLINIINTMFNEGYTYEEMYEEFGDGFKEYRNKVFSETFDCIKDTPSHIAMKAAIIYMQNKNS